MGEMERPEPRPSATTRVPETLRRTLRAARRGARELRAHPLVTAAYNVDAHRLQRDRPLPLDDEARRVLSALEQDGLAITTLARLGEAPERLAGLQEELRRGLLHAAPGRSKRFLRYVFGEDESVLDLARPSLRWQIAPRVLAIVNAYKRGYSWLYLSSLSLCIPAPPETAAVMSQRWHQDPSHGDLRMCKMFVYLNDVGPLDGPFTFIPKTHLCGARGAGFARIRARGLYPDDRKSAELRARLEDLEAYAVPCTGPAGTVIFADTSAFHRGGASSRGERAMLTAEYTSPGSTQHQRFQRPSDLAERARSLPLASRFALGLQPGGRARHTER